MSVTNKSRLLPGSFKISNVGLTVVHSVFSDLSLRSSSWGANLIIFYKSVNCGLEIISLLIGQNQDRFFFISKFTFYKCNLQIRAVLCNWPLVLMSCHWSRFPISSDNWSFGNKWIPPIQVGPRWLRDYSSTCHTCPVTLDSFRLHHCSTLR